MIDTFSPINSSISLGSLSGTYLRDRRLRSFTRRFNQHRLCSPLVAIPLREDWYLPGHSRARPGALPVPWWKIDGPEDGGWSQPYIRGPAPAMARISCRSSFAFRYAVTRQRAACTSSDLKRRYAVTLR